MQGHGYWEVHCPTRRRRWAHGALLVCAAWAWTGCKDGGEKSYIWEGENGSLGGSANDDDSQADDSAECDARWLDVPTVPSDVVLVVDRSGSMNCNAPSVDPDCTEPVRVDTSQPSRWELLGQAVLQFDGLLERLKDHRGTRVGLTSFPVDGDCGVPDTDALRVPLEDTTPSHRAELEAVWDDEAEGRGPLSGTVLRTLETLRLQMHGGIVEQAPALVVVTDGGESCQDSALDELRVGIDDATTAYGFRTYVVGLPGSESARPLLSELAFLGNTGAADCLTDPETPEDSCHFDLAASEDLEDDVRGALLAIAEAERRCVFSLPEALDGPSDLGGMRLSAQPADRLPQRGDLQQCAQEDGFYYVDETRRVTLCPASCARWQGGSGSLLQVQHGQECEEEP